MKHTVALLLALVLVLVAFAPVSADRPQLWQEHDWDDTFEVVQCEGFSVMDRAVGHDSEYLYFNKDGLVVKTIYENQGVDNLFSSTNPSHVISGPYRFLTHVAVTAWDDQGNVTEWTRRYTGNFWNIQLPGVGAVYHETGQHNELVVNWQVIKEFKRVGLTKFDNDMLCQYFAD